MQLIKSDSGFLLYQKIFKQVQYTSSTFVVWQLVAENGQRVISETRLNSFNLDSGLLHFQLSESTKIKNDVPIYCYSEEGQFIFKTTISDIRKDVFSVKTPVEIQLLEDSDGPTFEKGIGSHISTYWKTKTFPFKDIVPSEHVMVKSMAQRSSRDQEFLTQEFNPVSLDEEDKIFADKRETPRARPKVDKLVKVKTTLSNEVHFLRLFDLSQGGIGFITMEPALFPKGCEVHVIGFQEFDLDDFLIATVMSQRAVDDTQIEYKIGCKFVDGQS